MSFRAGLLDGRRLVLAGGEGGGDEGAALPDSLRELGAWVDLLSDEAVADDETASAWVKQRLPLHGLVFDARPRFAIGGRDGLREALRLAWLATRAVATGALMASERPAKVTLIAPGSDAGPHSEAARTGLENLARTLSVEWARFGVTAVTMCPGASTSQDEVVKLVCFLHSRAGEYFSGCRFDLGVAAGAATGSGSARA